MVLETLRAAIEQKSVINLKYDDDLGSRTFEPYILFYTTQNNLTLAGYEVNPIGTFGGPRTWKQLTCALIRNPSLTGVTFIPEMTFNPLNKRYVRTLAHVRK